MKFPSVKSLINSATATFKRFTAEVIFALAGTIAINIAIRLDYEQHEAISWCLRAAMGANLGLLLSLSATLYAESRAITGLYKILLRTAGAVIAIALVFALNPDVRQADYARFFLLSLSFLLLVAFAPFTAAGSIHGFWQFNKTLFLRFLASVLYSVVLGLGLSVALGAIHYLFNLDFPYDIYVIIWAWITGLFGTLFFLTGVPADYAALSSDNSYPKALKIFTQYVLIPLATVYVVILLAYEVKILTEWRLPKGAVSYLILGYAVFGILSLLLVYPIRNHDENKWIKTYSRTFYFLLIPLLVLLFAAAGVRVFNYGVTPLRYFLLALACWLTFITVYFLLYRQQNIKIVPASLCLLAIVAAYGPQSTFSISAYSQTQVLKKLMTRKNAVQNGKFIPVKKLTEDEHDRIQSVVNYIVTNNDLDILQPYFNEDLDKVADSLDKRQNRRNSLYRYDLRLSKINWINEKLNLDNYVSTGTDWRTYSFSIDNPLITISGYDYMIEPPAVYERDTTVFNAEGINIATYTGAVYNYTIVINGQKATFNLNTLAKKLHTEATRQKLKQYRVPGEATWQEYHLPEKMLLLSKKAGPFSVNMLVKRIQIGTDADTVKTESIEALYMVKKP